MSIILIRCPKTGRYISTGLAISSDCMDFLGDVQPPVHCPACEKDHSWTKQDALVVPPERWSMEPKVEDCFLKAIEAADQAEAAASVGQRNHYLRMEQKWIALAEGYQFLTEIAGRYG